MEHKISSILLGGGCFWCTEAIFKDLKGVISVTSGYAGGAVRNPTYKQVCRGETGHTEVVKIVFDPQTISLEDILHIFFTTHDPTQLNRQGNDVGTQYRSVIFGNEEQQKIAQKVKNELTQQHIWDKPIVTSIEPAAHFWEAEKEHADYFARNPHTAYCAAVVAPKVAKARKIYGDFFRKSDES